MPLNFLCYMVFPSLLPCPFACHRKERLCYYLVLFMYLAYPERGDKIIKEVGNLQPLPSFSDFVLPSSFLRGEEGGIKSQQANFPCLH